MLPLLIKGLTGAARAAETFDTLRRSSRELDRYGRKLKRELTIYQTTLVELLEGIVKSDDELQEMMLDTESHLWIRYDAAVRQRLGHRYESFIETVEEIEDELQELVNRLDLKTVSSTTLERDEKSWSKEIRRFKMAFNKDAYQELCNRIQELNNFLTNVTQSSLRSVTNQQQKRLPRAEYGHQLKRLREDARNIHRTVTDKAYWQCACGHQVMLRMRPALGSSSIPEGPELLPGYWRLGVDEPMSTDGWLLLELYPQHSAGKENELPPSYVAAQTSEIDVSANGEQHVRPILHETACAISVSQRKVKKTVQWKVADDVPPISMVQMQMTGVSLANPRINNMCSSQLSITDKDVGYIEGPDSWKCSVKCTAREQACAMNVGRLLDRNSHKASAACVVFSRRERLAVAATLALSVLFLDGSWLKPVWSSDDIDLVRDVDVFVDKQGTQHKISDLAFSWTSCLPTVLDGEVGLKCQSLRLQRKTAALFALAMTLIELSLGEPMSKLQTEEERQGDFVSSNVAAASRLLPRIQDASGFEYSEVVRKCLDCPFDIRDPTMDNETFLSICFDEIARPLMNDYEQFIGFK
ncbi:hypothetical protein PMZ80_006324 [Knufia obscura]|uniref:DUF7580 domain-containing protein n=1 Tax=Knufia obscura TaxID=1635080 RepID=A0ABR0RL45_9EURO|nr:hypothetical protein PMZ80_006324 [Knufia obscura]